MKILITTAIYPPEIGGPSFYAEGLKNAFEKQGHDVQVVLFGKLKKFPTGVRHLLYALKVLRAARGAEAIVTLDTFSTAVPVGLVAPFIRAPIICRVGGDFVWEQYVERTRDLVPLPSFYERRAVWNAKERLSFRLIRFALSHMQVVFSSSWQRDIWRKPYALIDTRVGVIENVIPARIAALPSQRKNFLLLGRQLILKNADAFSRAFEEAKKKLPRIELDEGLVPRDELFERLKSAYAVALPSVSDVTPNLIIESITCGKPFLLTKYSAYAERFKSFGVIVDPLSQEDMTRGILELADAAVYERLSKNIVAFADVRTYDDIAVEFMRLIKAI